MTLWMAANSRASWCTHWNREAAVNKWGLLTVCRKDCIGAWETKMKLEPSSWRSNGIQSRYVYVGGRLASAYQGTGKEGWWTSDYAEDGWTANIAGALLKAFWGGVRAWISTGPVRERQLFVETQGNYRKDSGPLWTRGNDPWDCQIWYLPWSCLVRKLGVEAAREMYKKFKEEEVSWKHKLFSQRYQSIGSQNVSSIGIFGKSLLDLPLIERVWILTDIK